jgi:hypothetical protein
VGLGVALELLQASAKGIVLYAVVTAEVLEPPDTCPFPLSPQHACTPVLRIMQVCLDPHDTLTTTSPVARMEAVTGLVLCVIDLSPS